MAEPLRILIVEDSPDDAALMAREVRRAGFDVSYERVESASELSRALSDSEWDLILSDYSLPSLTGEEVLEEVQTRGLDLPFIVVSGAITEETAVAAMKAGAHDYVLKDNLARLGPSIARELREARLRSERRGVKVELAALKERTAGELRRSRDQLDVILRGVGEGIVAQDASGEIVYVNAAADRTVRAGGQTLLGLGGRKAEETAELRDEQGRLLSPGDLPAAIARAQGRLAERVVRAMPRGGGEERWYIVTSTPIFDAGSKAWMVITIFRDITEQKRAEAAARFMADAGRALAASLDYEATLRNLANSAVPRLGDWCAIELAVEEGVGRTTLALADPDGSGRAAELHEQRPEVARALFGSGRVLETGAPELRTDISEEASRHVAPDPAARALLAELSPTSSIALALTTRGQIVGTLTLVFQGGSGRRHSTEDLRVAEELSRRGSLALEHADFYRQAREAIAARDEFLSVASHELKTPLTGLLLQLQRLERQTPRPDPRLASAIRQGHRLGELVESMLDVSRVSVGRLTLRREQVDLAELVREVVEDSTEEAARAEVRVELNVKGPLVGEWDRVRLEQILTQLLANALKYGAGKPIEVSVEGTASTACLSVRDHGPGIAERDLPRIFERFERAASPRQYGGLGLGLFLVRKIVEVHGGTLRVDSRPGEGSTFTVLLPRSPASAGTTQGVSMPLR